MKHIFFIVYLSTAFLASHQEQTLDHKVLKCLVCRKLVELMELEIEKVDANKKIEVGSYRMDHQGNQANKPVEYRRSDIFLTEKMEKICDKMEDYVRARKKSSGELIIFPLVTETGKMNPIMSEVDVIQDSDLNRSLKFYCEAILEENDEGIIKAFKKPDNNMDIKICTEIANLCESAVQDEYEFEDREEL